MDHSADDIDGGGRGPARPYGADDDDLYGANAIGGDEEEEEAGSKAAATSDGNDDAVDQQQQMKRKPCVRLRCISKEENGGKGGGGAAEAPIKGFGILQRHAYSLVDMKEVAGYRLVRIRNPWGQGEWTGPWSDKVLYGWNASSVIVDSDAS